MKQIGKKALCWLLTLAIPVGMLSVSGMAADAEDPEWEEPFFEEERRQSDAADSEDILFSYDDEGIDKGNDPIEKGWLIQDDKNFDEFIISAIPDDETGDSGCPEAEQEAFWFDKEDDIAGEPLFVEEGEERYDDLLPEAASEPESSMNRRHRRGLAGASPAGETEPVADVDGTGFASFTAALASWAGGSAGSTLKLLQDVETGSLITVSGTKNLDLNGHGIRMTGSGSVISVPGGAKLTIKDSNSGTSHRFDAPSSGAGSVILDEASGNLTVKGGYITGGNAGCGGGIYVSSGTLIMTGGTIIGNRASGSTDRNSGGGVGLEANARFEMSGGSIICNTASAGGGGVYQDASSVITLSGSPVIKDNEVTSGGPGKGLYVSSKLVIGGELTDGAEIYVYRNADGGTAGAFTEESEYIGEDTPSHFICENEGDAILAYNGSLYIDNAFTVTYNANGGTGDVPVDSTKYSSSTSVTVTVSEQGGLTPAEGFAFDGWNTQIDGSGEAYAAGDTFSISADTILYAQWRRAYSLVGTAQTGSGQGISGASVSLKQGDATIANGTTDSDGAFSFADVSLGTYSVTVSWEEDNKSHSLSFEMEVIES